MKSNLFAKIVFITFIISSATMTIATAVLERPIVALIAVLVFSITLIILIVFVKDEGIINAIRVCLACANVFFAVVLMAAVVFITAHPERNLFEGNELNNLAQVLAFFTVFTFYYQSLISRDFKDIYRKTDN